MLSSKHGYNKPTQPECKQSKMIGALEARVACSCIFYALKISLHQQRLLRSRIVTTHLLLQIALRQHQIES